MAYVSRLSPNDGFTILDIRDAEAVHYGDPILDEILSLESFTGVESILDSSGNIILDSSNNPILGTATGAKMIVHTINNILDWFRTNADHIVQDSGYTNDTATYELINS